VIAIDILPLHSLRYAAEIFDRARSVKTDHIVQNVDMELLARFELEGFADLLGDDYLKFWGNFDGVHGDAPWP
jgi:hypothetical protein